MDPVVNPPSMMSPLYPPLFMSGYLAILELEKSAHKEAILKHLSELMVDAAVYGWDPVRAFHTIWL